MQTQKPTHLMQNRMFLTSIVVNFSRIVSKDFLLVPTIMTEVGMLFLELQDLGTAKKARIGLSIQSLSNPSEVLIEVGSFEPVLAHHGHEDWTWHKEPHSCVLFKMEEDVQYWSSASEGIIYCLIDALSKVGVKLDRS